MAKKNYIKIDFEAPLAIIGIASNEKIWKVCWGINQHLGLNLIAGRQELSELNARDQYEDLESDPDLEYTLIDKDQLRVKRIPKAAKGFRFWLTLKLKREATPDITGIVSRLNEIRDISLAVDLSANEDLNKMLS